VVSTSVDAAGVRAECFSSAVLAEGRVVAIGGEDNGPPCSVEQTNLGAIYDPIANTWTPLSAPSGWTYIGNAPNVVLPDGQLLVGNFDSTQIARLDPVTLTWTNLNSTGKADSNNEETWTLLPDGTVLTVDIAAAPQSERYFPQTDTWEPAGNTVAPLITNWVDSGGTVMGPSMLRPNGTVFVAGSTGHTVVYNVATGAWAAGPDFPVSDAQQSADGNAPGAVLPSGHVLVEATFYDPYADTFFFEFDGTHLNPVPGPPYGSQNPADITKFLLLPSGQVLYASGGNVLNLYTPGGSADSAWAPTIASAPSMVQPGLTYPITGTQFNGLSQAVSLGGDYEAATNYPLIRIVNTATGHAFYCRTQRLARHLRRLSRPPAPACR
jgi:hypothetical protein